MGSSQLIYYSNGEMITIKQSSETDFIINKSKKTQDLLKKLNKLEMIDTSFVKEKMEY